MSTETPTPGTWVIDTAHSSVEFQVRHMMVSKVKGRFTDFEGTIVIGEDHNASAVTASVVTGSVDTHDEKRDEHVRSADFFDADNFKTMSFKSTTVSPDGKGWKLVGDLTIKDVTKPVEFELEYNGTGTNPWGAQVAGFEASTTINRSDYGLNFNAALETGGVLLSDEIKINLEIEANPQG